MCMPFLVYKTIFDGCHLTNTRKIVTYTMPQLINVNIILVALLLFLPISASVSSPFPDLELTASERQWLQDNPTVSFTGDPNWLPYEAFDSNGQYIGIVSEHLKLIAGITGIRFIMSPSKTWTESTEKAKNGLVDVLSETDESDLKSHLVFTDNYLSNPIVIAMHNQENYVEDITKIKDRKIALIKDYGYASKIRRKYSYINFITVDDIQSGLIAVSTGEADALLCTLALCSYTIADLGLNNVRIVGKTEFDTKLALGVQKYHPELVSILNKAISKITPGQQQVILDDWIKDKFVAKTDYTLAYQITAVAIFLLAIFAFWNRHLSQEIDLRVATENELKSAEEVLRLSHQRLLLHREQTPLAVIEWNTEFEFIYWNKAAERIFGFTEEEVTGRHATKMILPESARETVNSIWQDLLANKSGERNTNENITKDGRTILCEWYNTPLVDDNGKVIGVTSIVDDITERKQSEEMIWRQANFDMLTDLPNRNMFHDRLAQEIIK
jgi:two-component system, NarL family, sensor histidine kinase EvgS